jgi:hypothetical protein
MAANAATAAAAKNVSQFWSSRNWLWTALIIYCAIKLTWAWQQHDFFRQVLYATILSQMPTTVLHELGHAFAAAMAGTMVTRIKLGLTQNPEGPHLSFRFLDFPWEIYALPVAGSVHHTYPTQADSFKSRAIFITAAGPLVSLTAALVGYAAYALAPSARSAPLLLGWGIANFVIFIFTIVPMSHRRGNKSKANDGLNVWRYLFMPREEVRKKSIAASTQAEALLVKEEAQQLSLDQLIARYDAAPESLGTLIALLDKLEDAKDPRQADYVTKLLSFPNLESAHLQLYLDISITRCLDEGLIGPNPHFDLLSQKVLELSGNSVTAQGTRGSVLIDLGRVEEGRAMLLDVLARTDSDVDKAYSNIFLALAEKYLGNLHQAREYARAATKFEPNCPALRRVADLLQPAAEPKL